jgi:hypothetical protein
MLFSGFHAVERAEITAFFRFRINLAGIKPVFSRFQFPDHDFF